MRIIEVENYDEMSNKAAAMIASQIILKPNSILGLATGGTPIGTYKKLVKIYNNNEVDFSEVKTFNLDEYYGVTDENKESYHYYMMENLFKYINIDKKNINIPNGMAKNIAEECEEYEEKIRASGGINLQILGIGVNGHIGFNEPDIKFEAQTHLVNLNEKTIKSNSRFFNSIDEVPTKAISMGIKTILNSEKIVLLASGASKAEAVAEAVNGKISSKVPASILQLHKDITMIVDKEAGSKL